MVFRLKSTNVICLPIILLHLSNDGCLIFSRSTGRVWLRPTASAGPKSLQKY